MKSSRTATGYKGVTQASSGSFQAQIRLFGKVVYLGSFSSAKEAAEIFDSHYDKYKNKTSEFYSRHIRLNTDQMGYFGVHQYTKYVTKIDRYYAQIHQNKKRIYLGTYDSAVEAALAVNRYLDKIGDSGPRNDIQIKDIVELKRKRAKEQEQREKYLYEKDMERLKVKHYKKGPEAKIQRDIIRYLTDRQWLVRVLHGNTYQAGLTDLIAFHKKYGIRLIEIKNPISFHFTAAQLIEFPKIISHGTPIYILTAANDENYKRLFGPSNLWIYLSGISDKK